MKQHVLPLIGAAAFGLLGVARAFSETPLELLDRATKDLQTQIDAAVAKRTEAAKSEKAGKTPDEAELLERLGARENYPLQRELQVLQQIRTSLAADRTGDVLRVLQQADGSGVLPEDVRKDLDALVQALSKVQADREETYSKEVDAACKQAGEVLLKANEPKELDETLRLFAQLSAKAPVRDYYNGGESRFGNKIQAAIQFVSHWQDYLLARRQDDSEGQSSALRNLSSENNYAQVALVPRSEILARIPRKEPMANPERTQTQVDDDALAIVQGIKKLDDLSAGLAKLVDLQKKGSSQVFRSDSALSVAILNLRGLEGNLLEIRNGLATSLSLKGNRNDFYTRPDVNNALLPLRVQLIKMALPRLLGAPEGEKPKADEEVDAYLHRLTEAAKQRQDWAAVVRGLELKQTLANMNSTTISTASNQQEIEAFKNFFAGINLETAGQYEQAVISYLTALRSGQMDLPAAAIGARLTAIEKAHSAEFASAKEYVLNPPRPAYNSLGDSRLSVPPGFLRGGNDPRFPNGRPGFPNQTPVEEKLEIPAASSSPSPKPSPTSSATATPAP